MASFERGTSPSEETQQYQKYPLKRLEPAIQKFLKVLQIDLARLHRHKLNIERHHERRDWTSLHTEQINATRAVQQIKANITEIEKSRLQVEEGDLAAFDKKIESMKEKALESVREFVDLTEAAQKKSGASSRDLSPNEEHPQASLASHGEDQALMQADVPVNTDVLESWENLQENLEDLNSMIHDFATMVDDQQEKVDNIENNVEKAHSSVKQGAGQLGKAMGYKAAIFPVAGAVLGTCLAGPVGLFAGAKIGGVLGVVGGGTFGFISGKFLKKRSDKITEIELSKLSRSNSSPDIHQDTCQGSWFGASRRRNQSTAEVNVSDQS